MKKIFLVFAVLAIGMLATAQEKKENKVPPPPPPKVVKVEPPPPPPPPPPLPPKPKMSEDMKVFLERNKDVKTVSWFNNSKSIRVYLKSGSKEEYNLDIKEEKERAVKKYGELPKAPPPPPKVIMEKFSPPPPPPPKNGD